MQVELVNDGPMTIIIQCTVPKRLTGNPAVGWRSLSRGDALAPARCYPLLTAFQGLTKWAQGAHFC